MRGGGQGYEARRWYAGKAAEAKPVSWRRALGRGDAGISVYGEIIGASEYQDTVCMLEFLIKDGCLGHLKTGFGPWICWIGDGATQAARIVNVGMSWLASWQANVSEVIGEISFVHSSSAMRQHRHHSTRRTRELDLLARLAVKNPPYTSTAFTRICNNPSPRHCLDSVVLHPPGQLPQPRSSHLDSRNGSAQR